MYSKKRNAKMKTYQVASIKLIVWKNWVIENLESDITLKHWCGLFECQYQSDEKIMKKCSFYKTIKKNN